MQHIKPYAHAITGVAASALTLTALRLWRALDHRESFPRSWRGGFPTEITDRTAALILNARRGDTASVERNYRKLMMSNHPDRGGSTYLSATLSEAYTKLTAKK